MDVTVNGASVVPGVNPGPGVTPGTGVKVTAPGETTGAKW